MLTWKHSGGRDLLKDVSAKSDGPAVLVGGPAFRQLNDQPGSKEPDTHLLTATLRSGMSEDIKSNDLAALPAAREEAGRVAAALGGKTGPPLILAGAKASEARLRQIAAPRVLHLATHGFFLSEIKIPEGFGQRERGPVSNPMYRSGIALAGAQNTFDQWSRGEVPELENDGILMAAEVVELKLRGTDLVTLSACSTAVGESLSGEGVMGLRRGFVMAGARNLLMTLWPVDDKATADFMEDFYQHYAASGNAPKALTVVQREWLVRLRKEKNLVHAVNRAGPFMMSSQGRIEKSSNPSF